MKRFLIACLFTAMMLGLGACGKDSDPVAEASDKIIEEIRTSESVKDVGTELEAEKPNINGDRTEIIYKAKSGTELHLAIKADGTFVGMQVIGDITDESDDFIALCASVTNIKDFNIDSNTYNKLGDVIKNRKENEKIGNLTAGCSLNGTKAKYHVMFTEYVE